jgi:hypothetical protein
VALEELEFLFPFGSQRGDGCPVRRFLEQDLSIF